MREVLGFILLCLFACLVIIIMFCPFCFPLTLPVTSAQAQNRTWDKRAARQRLAARYAAATCQLCGFGATVTPSVKWAYNVARVLELRAGSNGLSAKCPSAAPRLPESLYTAAFRGHCKGHARRRAWHTAVLKHLTAFLPAPLERPGRFQDVTHGQCT